MTPRQQRVAARWFHLFLGVVINTFVYVTLFHGGELRAFNMVVAWIVIPLTVLTAVFMWKPAWFRPGSRRHASDA